MKAQARAPDAPADARLVEIAAAHLRARGAPHVTIVAIAEEAGMSHANVYRYFPSKAALLEAVTQAWLTPLEQELRIVADAPDPAQDKIERMTAAIHRLYRDKSEADPALFKIFVEAVAAGRPAARRHRARLQSDLQRVVEEGIASGAFAIADQRRALTLIFDGLHRFLHPASFAADEGAPRRGIDQRFARLSQVVKRTLQSGRF